MELNGRRVLSYAGARRAAENRRTTSRTLAYGALGMAVLIVLAAALMPRTGSARG